MKILHHTLFLLTIVGLFFLPFKGHSQYNWETYTGDAEFRALEDAIDKGRILYHKGAQNNSTSTGNRGLLFGATLFAFPSLAGSFSWSQVKVNAGRISFYPHIYTFDNKTTALSVAILYNISRISPIRGVRTRPSFSPTSLLQLEKDRMNFTRLKFVSEGFETDITLQAGNQETELSLSDYDVNYNYWLKSTPSQKETMGLRTFFARPLTSFKIRAYSDKGYLDTTLSGARVAELSDIFVKTIDLYQRLLDPNYINTVKNTNTNTNTNTNAKATPKKAAPKKGASKKGATNTNATRSNAQRATRSNAQRATRSNAQRSNTTRAVQTNRRPKTTRVVTPS